MFWEESILRTLHIGRSRKRQKRTHRQNFAVLPLLRKRPIVNLPWKERSLWVEKVRNEHSMQKIERIVMRVARRLQPSKTDLHFTTTDSSEYINAYLKHVKCYRLRSGSIKIIREGRLDASCTLLRKYNIILQLLIVVNRQGVRGHNIGPPGYIVVRSRAAIALSTPSSKR